MIDHKTLDRQTDAPTLSHCHERLSYASQFITTSRDKRRKGYRPDAYNFVSRIVSTSKKSRMIWRWIQQQRICYCDASVSRAAADDDDDGEPGRMIDRRPHGVTQAERSQTSAGVDECTKTSTRWRPVALRAGRHFIRLNDSLWWFLVQSSLVRSTTSPASLTSNGH